MKVRAQIMMVLNLDKCIGCHTCSVTCKNVWTNRKGAEYMWFNDVETKPGSGYPKRWEDQAQWKGGWELGRNGRLKLKGGGRFAKLATIFSNPKLPEIADYYEGFSNGTLWPLYHDVIAKPEYDREWWNAYVAVNEKFAEATAHIAGEGALVWVQDYQLQLVPRMLREIRPDLKIGFFLHIPFPPVELFMQLPWRAEIVDGLLGADLIGFHLPDGATLKRTEQTGENMRQMFAKDEAVAHTFIVSGFDLIGGGNKPNAGTIFIPLKDWSERQGKAQDLAGKFMGFGMMQPDGIGLVFNPPPIRGLGTAGGFEVYVQNRVDGDARKLNEVVQNFMAELQKHPEFTRISTFFRPTVPQLFVEVNEQKALALGIPIGDIYSTLQSTMGALYVNDFNKAGRVYRVQLQAEANYRMKPDDIGKVYVKSTTTGAMIPLSAVSVVKNIVGPEQIERFNGFIAAKVMGDSKPGISSGDAIKIVEEVAAATLPDGYGVAWTGQAFQEKRSSGSSLMAFGFAVVMVFLILAAQYEKWSLPVAVVMAVPFALMGALTAIWVRGMPNDIYFQIGLVVLIGLASKNAILIVEFAAQKYEEGMSAAQAAVEAARLRLRPIIMTSLAFVLGVFPLVKATGAGAGARQSMGTGVFGGMLAATFIATLFVPLFFKWLERGKQQTPTAPTEEK